MFNTEKLLIYLLSFILFMIFLPWLSELAGLKEIGKLGYLFFSGVCHQNPLRSFLFMGVPLSVCARCFGIYFGLWAGAVLGLWFKPGGLRTLILIALFVLFLDVFLNGLWLGLISGLMRFLTGGFFGFLSGVALTNSIREFNSENKLRKSNAQS